MHSETLSEISKALVEFQSKLTPVIKDSDNPFYKSKYASLETIWQAIRGPLAECGLSIVQPISCDGDKVTLDTILLHTSGEWISGSMPLIPVKCDPQGWGSVITYARRYALSAMIGVVSDEDDDGNGNNASVVPSQQTKDDLFDEYAKTNNHPTESMKASKNQISALVKIVKCGSEDELRVLAESRLGRKLDSVYDMTFTEASRWITEAGAVRRQW